MFSPSAKMSPDVDFGILGPMTEVYIEPKTGPVAFRDSSSDQENEKSFEQTTNERSTGIFSRIFGQDGTTTAEAPKIGCDIQELDKPIIARVAPIEREEDEKIVALLSSSPSPNLGHNEITFTSYFATVTKLVQSKDSEWSKTVMKITTAPQLASKDGANLLINKSVCEALDYKLGDRVLLSQLKKTEVLDASKTTPVITCRGSNNKVRNLVLIPVLAFDVRLQ